MRKPTPAAHGTLHTLDHDSAVLAGNTPGDPTRRQVLVYTPPDYDESKNYPLLMDLVGYTGSGFGHASWKPFGLNLIERLDWLISTQGMSPVVAVLPDCFTAYGGNQYINSSATGRYMDYLIDEILPLVEGRFAAGGDRTRRGVFGKSSGGYGSFIHGMTRASTWGAFASHSGDAFFEYAYMSDFPRALRELAKHDESVTKFLEHVWGKEKLSHDEVMVIMTLGMAAHYDPDPAAPHGFQIPFDLHTGAIKWDRWERWLKHDPVRLAEESIEPLRTLRGIYFDCGSKDQFHLVYGNRMIHQTLETASVPHQYHEFDDDHSDVDYRMNISLPWLAGVLSRG